MVAEIQKLATSAAGKAAYYKVSGWQRIDDSFRPARADEQSEIHRPTYRYLETHQ